MKSEREFAPGTLKLLEGNMKTKRNLARMCSPRVPPLDPVVEIILMPTYTPQPLPKSYSMLTTKHFPSILLLLPHLSYLPHLRTHGKFSGTHRQKCHRIRKLPPLVLLTPGPEPSQQRPPSKRGGRGDGRDG